MRRSARLEEYVQGRRHEVDWGAHMSTPLLPEAVLEIDANPVSLLGGGGGSGIKYPLQVPTSIPSGILMHPAVWPHWPKIWGKGELGPHVTQCRLGRGLHLYQVAS